MRPRLYHYTCDHGWSQIGGVGFVVPSSLLVPGLDEFVWLTDLDVPMRDALGLTSRLVRCDRTAHRYRVTDDSDVVPWTVMRREVDSVRVAAIEAAPGASLGNWWVSRVPVPVVLDEIPTRVRVS